MRQPQFLKEVTYDGLSPKTTTTTTIIFKVIFRLGSIIFPSLPLLSIFITMLFLFLFNSHKTIWIIFSGWSQSLATFFYNLCTYYLEQIAMHCKCNIIYLILCPKSVSVFFVCPVALQTGFGLKASQREKKREILHTCCCYVVNALTKYILCSSRDL